MREIGDIDIADTIDIMNVIPVINCPDAACAREKLAVLAAFYPSNQFVHLDVTDGVFSKHETWQDPVGWAALHATFPLEAHLMVEKPADYTGPWIAAGAKRLVIPVESVTRESFEAIIEIARVHDVEITLSLNPETPIDVLRPYFDVATSFQILAVHPGPAGQAMIPGMFEKTTELRRARPDAIIEFDGGVNPQMARQAKNAGADVVASGSYIFNAADAREAYQTLKDI